MIQGDTTILPQLFVRNPGWHVMFDMDAAAAEATRRRIYDRLAADKMPVQGYHFPFPALGRVEKTGSGYRVNVIPSQATATVDVRLLPDDEPEKFLQAVRNVVDDVTLDVHSPLAPEHRSLTHHVR